MLQSTKLREAAQALVTKLEEIEQHPDFIGVCQLAHLHGFKYRGPNWEQELKCLREAIHMTEEWFTCPLCGSHYFGTSDHTNPDAAYWKRYCKGRWDQAMGEYTGCTYTWVGDPLTQDK